MGLKLLHKLGVEGREREQGVQENKKKGGE